MVLSLLVRIYPTCNHLFGLQTFLLQHNQNKALSPKELQHRLSRLLINNPAMAEAVMFFCQFSDLI